MIKKTLNGKLGQNNGKKNNEKEKVPLYREILRLTRARKKLDKERGRK